MNATDALAVAGRWALFEELIDPDSGWTLCAVLDAALGVLG